MSKVDPYSPALHHPAPVRSTSTTLHWTRYHAYFDGTRVWRQPPAHQSICCLDDVVSVACAPVKEIDSALLSADEIADTFGLSVEAVSVRRTQRGVRRLLGRKWESP